jgi:hypothetical protein
LSTNFFTVFFIGISFGMPCRGPAPGPCIIGYL